MILVVLVVVLEYVIVNAMRHCDMVIGLSELVRENNVKEKEGKERARGEMKTNLKNTRKN